jgi:hypothetical protein
VLVCAACGSSPDEPAPISAPAPGGAPSGGQPPPNAIVPTTATPAGADVTGTSPEPGGSRATASQEAPAVGGLPSSAEADAGGVEPAAAEPSNGSDGAEPSSGEAPAEPNPTTDENLAFILKDGFETTYFAVHCTAISEDGSEIDGDTVTELPVGGGYLLECNIDGLPSRATTDVLSAADEPWCALGELLSFETGGDERLDIELVSPPDSPSPALIATSDTPITLQLASAFGAPLWPVWLVTSYDAVQVARAEQGKLCDQVFGL